MSNDTNTACGRLVCDVKISAKELIRCKSYDLTGMLAPKILFFVEHLNNIINNLFVTFLILVEFMIILVIPMVILKTYLNA